MLFCALWQVWGAMDACCELRDRVDMLPRSLAWLLRFEVCFAARGWTEGLVIASVGQGVRMSFVLLQASGWVSQAGGAVAQCVAVMVGGSAGEVSNVRAWLWSGRQVVTRDIQVREVAAGSGLKG